VIGMALEKTWRWFGDDDTVSLAELRQIGVEGVVTALHHIPNGEAWSVDDILRRKRRIEDAGLRWSVVESLPVSEGIKIHSGDYPRLIANYQASLRNLGACGIDTVCYNFMPVLDWVRTDLHYRVPAGGEGMCFDFTDFVAFDVFILKRAGAAGDYPDDVVEKAAARVRAMDEAAAETLAHTIIVVTQGFINGAVDGAQPDCKQAFLDLIARYKGIDRDGLRRNLSMFLRDVVPVAEASGVRLCVHPDDPPFPVLGLPRIVSTLDDLKWICEQCESRANGVTFCAGSLSVRKDNDLPEMVRQLAGKIHFIHLRNNQFTEDGFYESGHLQGSIDMYAVMRALLEEQRRRVREGRRDSRMPLRPDHGLKLLDDFHRNANPGYPLIGRLKGLAELSGLEAGIERGLDDAVKGKQ
jgi:mannonate dehydratase